ncbi:MAG: DUF58 domain-containing protein [Candidatus Hinthialibacter antarcticus]|nr:DUF58 domain-containing protein [Candidatus Hinthialibacter antarcticus]
MQNGLHFLNPDELAGIADLQLLARRVVEGFLAGLHRSPHFGSSIEFAQYRQYVQGDDPRFVDWGLYARTDRLHTKQFHEETNLRCSILLDSSASMSYASGAVSKLHYARMLAACLAMLLVKQNDSVGLSAFQDSVRMFLPPRSSSRHLQQVLVELANVEPGGQTNLAEAVQHACETLPLRSMVILISDLLDDEHDFSTYIRLLRARGFDVLVLQISDPAERDFSIAKSTLLIDPENQRQQFVVPDDMREEYLENRRAYFEAIRTACIGMQVELDEFDTAEPLDRALHFFLQQRQQLMSAVSGRRAGAGGGV